MSDPLSTFERQQRDLARRDRTNRIIAWGILFSGAALIALGAWALVTLLIGAFG